MPKIAVDQEGGCHQLSYSSNDGDVDAGKATQELVCYAFDSAPAFDVPQLP